MKTSFRSDSLVHVYQRAVDKGVIFYTLKDRLVYYSLAAVQAKRRGMKVAAASIMFTHVHFAAQTVSKNNICLFLQGVNASFSRLYNNHYRRSGQLFSEPGMACKTTWKSKKTNLIYVFNNHVEKGLCSTPMAERWSFLAYSKTSHPFSREYDSKNSSRKLVKAINLVNRRVAKLQALLYCDLDKIFPLLNPDELETFADYVISRYALIDFQFAASFFHNMDSLIIAVESSTGSEYEIREEYSSKTDIPYVEMSKMFGNETDVKLIFSDDLSGVGALIDLASRRTHVSIYQMEKFFHLKKSEKTSNLPPPTW